jgi:hypothetical protein
MERMNIDRAIAIMSVLFALYLFHAAKKRPEISIKETKIDLIGSSGSTFPADVTILYA